MQCSPLDHCFLLSRLVFHLLQSAFLSCPCIWFQSVYLGANPLWNYNTVTVSGGRFKASLGQPAVASALWHRGACAVGSIWVTEYQEKSMLASLPHRCQWFVRLWASRMCSEEQYHPDLEAALYPRGADPGNWLHHAYPWASFKVRFCFDGKSPLKVNI